MVDIKENSKIFVCGDIHGHHDINKLSNKNWPEQKNLSEHDILIQVGDFGLIWNYIPDDTEKYWLKWLDNKKYYTLFIAGNHDNFHRLNTYPLVDFYGGLASQISEKVFYLKNGYVYNFGGRLFWLFGGAESIDKQYRIPYISWWPEEASNITEMNLGLDNLKKYNFEVDYIITHTVPSICLPSLVNCAYNDVVSNYLNNIYELTRNKYKSWYCGHFHVDLELKNYNITILYDNIKQIK